MDMAVAGEARSALRGPGWSFEHLAKVVPHVPGLYAFHSVPGALSDVEWDVPFDGSLLYVGKAERSLASRDVSTHFGTGRTGSSTVRRSLAALLRDELDLDPRPRSETGRLYPSNYALEPDGDARLTSWMEANLRLAVWPSPASVDLGCVETEVIRIERPSLNLDKSPSRSAMLSARRAAMAREVRVKFGELRDA